MIAPTSVVGHDEQTDTFKLKVGTLIEKLAEIDRRIAEIEKHGPAKCPKCGLIKKRVLSVAGESWMVCPPCDQWRDGQ